MSNSQIGNYNQNLKVEMENTNKVEGQIGKYKQGWRSNWKIQTSLKVKLENTNNVKGQIGK